LTQPAVDGDSLPASPPTTTNLTEDSPTKLLALELGSAAIIQPTLVSTRPELRKEQYQTQNARVAISTGDTGQRRVLVENDYFGAVILQQYNDRLISLPPRAYKYIIDDDERVDKSSKSTELFLNVGDKLKVVCDGNNFTKEGTIIDFNRGEVVVAYDNVYEQDLIGLKSFTDMFNGNRVCAVNNVQFQSDDIALVFVKRNPKRSRELIQQCITRQQIRSDESKKLREEYRTFDGIDCSDVLVNDGVSSNSTGSMWDDPVGHEADINFRNLEYIPKYIPITRKHKKKKKHCDYSLYCDLKIINQKGWIEYCDVPSRCYICGDLIKNAESIYESNISKRQGAHIRMHCADKKHTLLHCAVKDPTIGTFPSNPFRYTIAICVQKSALKAIEECPLHKELFYEAYYDCNDTRLKIVLEGIFGGWLGELSRVSNFTRQRVYLSTLEALSFLYPSKTQSNKTSKRRKKKDVSIEIPDGRTICTLAADLYIKKCVDVVQTIRKAIISFDFSGLLHREVATNSEKGNVDVQASIKKVWNNTNLLFKVGCFYEILHKFPMLTHVDASELKYPYAFALAKAESIVFGAKESKTKMVEVVVNPLCAKANARSEQVSLAAKTAIAEPPDIIAPVQTELDAIGATQKEVSSSRCCDFMRDLPKEYWTLKGNEQRERLNESKVTLNESQFPESGML